MALKLRSAAFDGGGRIPVKHTCDGADESPPLAWRGAPEGVTTWALIMDDPDAPGGPWVHWVVFDLPGGMSELPGAVPPDTTLPGGGVHGENSRGRLGYGGPCPPGGVHRYVFTLYALDAALGLHPGAGKRDVLDAMEGHVLDEARVVGEYARSAE